jgi:hypothetical protein
MPLTIGSICRSYSSFAQVTRPLCLPLQLSDRQLKLQEEPAGNVSKRRNVASHSPGSDEVEIVAHLFFLPNLQRGKGRHAIHQ